MRETGRRTFLKTSTVWATASALRTYGAAPSEQIRLGLIGCGGQGTSLMKRLAPFPDVKIIAVADPDRDRRANVKALVGAEREVADLRQLLDDKSLDAVVIATPDHWHAPAGVLACQAGKHVYVEKPCSHNIEESARLVAAGQRHRRLVQHGTQSRSSEGLKEAIAMLREGLIGDVLCAKAINSQLRSNIGRAAPSAPPPSIDFDLWLGPAPERAYQSNLLHYHWHWFFDFGTGDIGNDGVHQIDVARWGLGVDGPPSRVVGQGAKLFFDDDQQFPDTYVVSYEFPQKNGRPKWLLFEQRIWTPYETEGCDNGNVFYGTSGRMTIHRGRIDVVSKDNRPMKQLRYDASHAFHLRNFLDAVKGNARLNAPIDIGADSSNLAHWGNIAARTDGTLTLENGSLVRGSDAAKGLIGRSYRRNHWAIPASA